MRWSFLANLPIALGVACLWTLLAFVVGRLGHRHATIDVFWGAGFLVIYLECFRIAHAGYSPVDTRAAAPSLVNRFVVLAFVAIWGLRLAIYLARRQRGAKEDPRYVMIMKGAHGRHETLYALRMIYGPGSVAVVRLDAAAMDRLPRTRQRPLRAGVVRRRDRHLLRGDR